MSNDLPVPESTARASSLKTVLIAIAVFALCSATVAVRSKGFLEADGATHYLYARHAIEQPYYFIDVWGRPLCTALFALPATYAGLIGVRITSLLMAIGCAWIAYRIAVGQHYRYPALAAIFTLGQPLLFLHSFSELTELPFALLIGAAFLAYQRRRWGIMAMLAALAPLGRPEGFGFLLLAAVALIAHHQFYWIAILPMGLAAWSIEGRALIGPHDLPWWKWLVVQWPYDANSSYARGSALHFFLELPMLVGPFAFPALWIGIAQSLRGRMRDMLKDHCRRVQWLIALIPLGVLIVHSALFALGKMSSNGELRYLLVVSPLWALLVASGWEWTFERFHWQGATRWAALAVVAPGLVNYAWRILPLEPSSSWREAQRVAAWYQRADVRLKYPRVLCNHPGIYFYLDISPTDPHRVVPWSKENVRNPGKGVLLLWDPEYCVRNAGAQYVVSLDDAIQSGWINDWKAEMLSNVNNPPPWEDYKISNPPPRPVDSMLPSAWMLWHIFKSPADIKGDATPSIRKTAGAATWLQNPASGK